MSESINVSPTVINPALANLYEQIADCPNCALARTRTQTVPGSGPAPAEVMCIGEAPGVREDEQGVPFVGAAGQFLDKLLSGIGLSRETVHITNVIKCRPPQNRDPAPEETAACKPFLDQQIEIVAPLLIVTLGRFSMGRWFPGESISRIHGRAKTFEERVVLPMYHPAAALHRGDLRPVIKADFEQIPYLLNEIRNGNRYSSVRAGDTSLPISPTANTHSAAEQRSLL
jgi:uracil-DNA glycosylase family 4